MGPVPGGWVGASLSQPSAHIQGSLVSSQAGRSGGVSNSCLVLLTPSEAGKTAASSFMDYPNSLMGFGWGLCWHPGTQPKPYCPPCCCWAPRQGWHKCLGTWRWFCVHGFSSALWLTGDCQWLRGQLLTNLVGYLPPHSSSYHKLRPQAFLLSIAK